MSPITTIIMRILIILIIIKLRMIPTTGIIPYPYGEEEDNGKREGGRRVYCTASMVRPEYVD